MANYIRRKLAWWNVCVNCVVDILSIHVKSLSEFNASILVGLTANSGADTLPEIAEQAKVGLSYDSTIIW